MISCQIEYLKTENNEMNLRIGAKVMGGTMYECMAGFQEGIFRFCGNAHIHMVPTDT